jgi:aspartyl-tRNA(Asn)/glutamyl-tRNA(Gln) amidotransferase subunit B
MLSEANARGLSLSGLKVSAHDLCVLIGFVERQEVSNLSAKSVLTEMIDSGKSADVIIKEKNLVQVSDTGQLESVVQEVINANPKSVADFKAGKGNALMFLVGQAMKKSQGKANPKVLQDLFKRRLIDA